MLIRTIVTGAATVLVSTAAVAQGAFDFDDIPGVNQEPTVVIDINPMMVGFVRGAVRQADPATADMLEGLRSISLRVYSDVSNVRQFNTYISNVTEELEDNGWMSMVSAQDAGSNVRIHMRMTEEQVSGMTVMMTDGSEAVFINIDGTLNAEDLGAVLAQFPVHDFLESWQLPTMPAPATLGAPPTQQTPPAQPTSD